MCNGRQERLLVMREVIVAMMVMREVMQPVEDGLADDGGWLERVIREGCPFLWGLKGYSSGGRWDLCWEEEVSAGEEGKSLLGRKGMSVGRRECSVGRKGMSVGGEGNLRRENRYPPYLRRKGIWEG